MPALFPSLISSKILDLDAEINRLQPFVDGFHIDVMDFHFVPNLTWGPLFVNAIRRTTVKQLWVHLMVDTPKPYLDMMKLNAKDIVSVHYESVSLLPLKALLANIKSNGQTASIAINPETPIASVAQLFQQEPYPAHILLMSVNPGFSGQTFLSPSLQRLQELIDLRKSLDASFTIGMDGGINPKNIHEIKKISIDQIAVGSGIFEQQDQLKAIQILRQ